MKTQTRLLSWALALCLFILGAVAGAAVRPLVLPPLSSEDRMTLVEYLHGTADLNRLWGFYYAYTDEELRQWNIRADAFDTAAHWLEVLPFPSRTGTAMPADTDIEEGLAP